MHIALCSVHSIRCVITMYRRQKNINIKITAQKESTVNFIGKHVVTVYHKLHGYSSSVPQQR